VEEDRDNEIETLEKKLYALSLPRLEEEDSLERQIQESIQAEEFRKKVVSKLAKSLYEEMIENICQATISYAKKLAPLSAEDQELAQEALQGNLDDVIVEGFNIEMTTKLLSCLEPGSWLNDEVMNFYLELLSERCKRNNGPNSQVPPERRIKCHFFNTFFYAKLDENGAYKYQNVKRWAKRAKVDILSQDKIITPIHVGLNHWCLAVVNFKKKRFEYYDSLGGNNERCLKNLRAYVMDEAKANKKPFDVRGWSDYMPKYIPRQTNGCDCGVFALKYADYLSEDLQEMPFSQKDMQYFRLRMIAEIVNKHVL